jgi:malto-oligosyltrehalose trehalohydrolase
MSARRRTLFGPLRENGVTRFRLFAPSLRDAFLEIEGRKTVAMTRNTDGFLDATAVVEPGARYRFLVPNRPVPDPASRRQSGGVHGWSVVTDDAYAWTDGAWKSRPWESAVLYEMHAGLCGGFAGVAAQLERLRELGFTAIELMPVSAFPGARNWGYDGVLPFAPAEAYGTPDELKALVDRAHALGLMMFVDVVYNHFGPDGNYLSTYAPEFFRKDLQTPWGSAIDFRNETVRRFFIENAHHWIDTFHFDGLRFDAVHAIEPSDWLSDLAREIRQDLPIDRYVHLVVENDANDSTLLRRGFDAQWDDDFHHALHVLLTKEQSGYYADYADAPARRLARILKEGFAYQGEVSVHKGAARGLPSADLPPTSFVSFLQNHDQVGNRALGERLTVLTDERALKAAIVLELLAAQIPLVFMGEEIGSRAPFLYFTDHEPELANAVREGRAREFAFAAEAALPDPNAVSTFEASRPENDAPHRSEWEQFYRDLLRLRSAHIVPRLQGARAVSASAVGDAAVVAAWRMGDGATLTIAANFGAQPAETNLPTAAPFRGNTNGREIPAYSTVVWLERA